VLEGWARRGNRDEDRRNSALPDQSPKCSGCSLVRLRDVKEWAKRGAGATHDIHSQPGAILLLWYRVRAEGRFALLGSTISAHPPLGTLTRNRCPHTVPGDWVSELTRDGRHETALQQFRDRMTDSRSNLSDFTAVQRVRGDLSDAVQSALQSGHGKRHVYFAAYSARLTGQWRAALKDFWQLIATSLKRRAILNRYRRVMKRQRADEAKISSPHIKHFGLKAKPRFAPDM